MQRANLTAFIAAGLIAGLVGCSTMTGKSTGEYIDDATITARVKTNLATERARTLTAVDVDTVRGTVYLTGTVPNESMKEMATELAQDVGGVERVVNNLQILAGDAPAETGDAPADWQDDEGIGDDETFDEDN